MFIFSAFVGFLAKILILLKEPNSMHMKMTQGVTSEMTVLMKQNIFKTMELKASDELVEHFKSIWQKMCNL